MLIFQRRKKNLSTLIYVNKLSRQWKLERKRNHQLQQQSNKPNACMPQLKRGFLNIPRVQSLSRAVHHYSASCGSVWSLSCWRALESDPRCPSAVNRQMPRHGSCVQLLLWNMRDLDQTHKDECPHLALLTERSLSSPQIPFGPNSWLHAKIHLSHWRTTENQEERLKKSASAWDRIVSLQSHDRRLIRELCFQALPSPITTQTANGPAARHFMQTFNNMLDFLICLNIENVIVIEYWTMLLTIPQISFRFYGSIKQTLNFRVEVGQQNSSSGF